jgi:hypothetical protein
MAEKRVPSEEEIRARAYEIYTARGGEDGQHQSDWLRAERELTEGLWIESGRAMAAAAGANGGGGNSGLQEQEEQEQGAQPQRQNGAAGAIASAAASGRTPIESLPQDRYAQEPPEERESFGQESQENRGARAANAYN